MNSKAKQLFHYLCTQYDKLSEDLESRPFPEFSETITHPLGHCFVRCAVGSQRFSIVSINFDPSVRGQGVLTAFINYVRNNPYHYQGVEVAIIENTKLAKRLLSWGWEYKSWFSKLFFSKKPTLIKDFECA
ncbi:hypothetical protein [Vibrio hyugaensis]|uniref:N-acetyltransferase domain-containing protein n=1 Tax=Vibrio hyugaensis TaxID=1534743 RepID=A0ABQ5Y7B4_9VIBR|nr:hypothetical protein [Vibrio hyugaensis]GLR05929.1 hypothetical protein GCM10007906_35170 [Vibrio hyugaensis]